MFEPDATNIALRGMVFVLLYSPCFATVVAIRQESGTWYWAAFAVLFNTILAYCLATVVFQIASRM